MKSKRLLTVSKRAFTLLELMVGIAILVMASSVLGWKMYDAIQKKRFLSEVEQLQLRLVVCHRIAVAMQSDWKGVLKQEREGWLFEAFCEEREGKKFSPLSLHSTILFEGKPKKQLIFHFFSSGQVSPSSGTLLFQRRDRQVEWRIEELFQREEGKAKRGPIHPSEKI